MLSKRQLHGMNLKEKEIKKRDVFTSERRDKMEVKYTPKH